MSNEGGPRTDGVPRTPLYPSYVVAVEVHIGTLHRSFVRGKMAVIDEAGSGRIEDAKV